MRSSALRPYLLIAPSAVFLLLLFGVPLVQTVALAFSTPNGAGFGNFARMLDDLDFSDSVRNTFELVICVVPLQLGGGAGHVDDAAAHAAGHATSCCGSGRSRWGSRILPRGWSGWRS